MSSFRWQSKLVWTIRLKPILRDRYISVLTLLQAAVASNPVKRTHTRRRLRFEVKGLFLPFNTSSSSHQNTSAPFSVISSLISTPSSRIISNKAFRQSVSAKSCTFKEPGEIPHAEAQLRLNFISLAREWCLNHALNTKCTLSFVL